MTFSSGLASYLISLTGSSGVFGFGRSGLALAGFGCGSGGAAAGAGVGSSLAGVGFTVGR